MEESIMWGHRLYTALMGQYVGKDSFGNRYYRNAKRKMLGTKERRWVMYNGIQEASKVPPDWHLWLHHTLDTPPCDAPLLQHEWGRPPCPNLSGTKGAYRPDRKSPQRYEPWDPHAA